VSDEQLDYLIKRHTTNEKRCNEVMVHVLKLREEIEKLKQQLAERDELIIELSDKVDFYGDKSNWMYDNGDGVNNNSAINKDMDCSRFKHIGRGGKLARTPLKNQRLLDEIKGRV
jgi:hypothetical protein